jgi:hypothetical protein
MAAEQAERHCANSIPFREGPLNVCRISDLASDFFWTYLRFSIDLPCIAIDVAQA